MICVFEEGAYLRLGLWFVARHLLSLPIRE